MTIRSMAWTIRLGGWISVLLAGSWAAAGVITLVSPEFQTAAKNGESPAVSARGGLPAGTELLVRERANDANPELEARAFLKFDVSGLDPLPIARATLQLHEYHKLNNVNSANLFVAQVTDPWDATTNKPTFDQAVTGDTQFGNNGPATSGPAVDIDFDVNVAPFVRQWHSGSAPNHGVRLRIGDAMVAAAFDHTGSQAPQLVVHQEESFYGQAILRDDPIVYWRLNETGGTTAMSFGRDGPAHDGTYVNAPTLGAAGPVRSDGFRGFTSANLAVSLDGQNDRIDFPALGIAGNAERTYEGWFNGTDAEQGYLAIAGGTGRRTGVTASNEEISMAVNGHRFGVIFDGARHSNTQYNRFPRDAFDPGWHHFAVVLPPGATTSDEFQFYVDGVDYTPYARTLAGSPKTVNTLNNPGSVGRNDTGEPLAGSLDEIAVYDRALTTSQVGSHYAAALGPIASITETTFEMSEYQSVAAGVHSGWPDGSTNTDRARLLRVRERQASGTSQETRTVAFFEFDLSGLEGEQVLGATLEFNQDSRNVNVEYLTLARVTADWTEADVAFDQAVADEFTFGGTNTSGTGDDKQSVIDVTDFVRDWVDGTTENYGFRLAFEDLEFVIADFYDTGLLAPHLTVTTMVVPEPSSAVLWCLAFAGSAWLGVRRRRRKRS